MVVIPIKPVAADESSADPDALFHEIQSLSDHEVQLTIGAVRPPKVPNRWVHPVSGQFPGLEGDAYDRLRDAIRKNGQRKAIAMLDGRIWDGRARYDACLDLGLVPRIWPIQRGDPINYLLDRHRTRYGTPRSPERYAALALLRRIETDDWKARADEARKEWTAEARRDFKESGPQPAPCVVCGLAREYSHAHHVLPLSLQYELGINAAIQDHEWLCHVHHLAVHRIISARLLAVRNDETYREDTWPYMQPEDRKTRPALLAVYARARDQYEAAGGVIPRGNYSMLYP